MDDAKENNAVLAAPGKPSWPLPSPGTGGSGGGGGRKRRPSSAAADAAAVLGDAAGDETILTKDSRRAVDVLAHMATTAAVRDLAAALEQLAVPGTAEEARRAAERALDGERNDEGFSRRASCFGKGRHADQCFAPMRHGCLCKNLRSGTSEVFSVLWAQLRGD